MLDVILVSNYSMKEELEQALLKSSIRFHDLMIQDIHHIERYPIKDEYNSIIIQSANAIKKIDSSNNHIYNAEVIYGIGPNCKSWVKKKFSLNCKIPESDYSSLGLIDKIEKDRISLGKTLLLKGIGGKTLIEDYLKSKDVDYMVSNVYERILNENNLNKVLEMTSNGGIIIGFSRSSIEPLVQKDSSNLKGLHFLVLDKSDEEIIDEDQVASLTKLSDIYDIDGIVKEVEKINE